MQGLLAQYVDDLLFFGGKKHPKELAAEIANRLECSPPESLRRYIGLDYSYSHTGCLLSQQSYLESLDVPSGSFVSQPLPTGILGEFDTSSPLDVHRHKQFRRLTGSLSWASSTCRPDLNFAAGYFSSRAHAPTEKAEELLFGAVRYAQHYSNYGILLRKPGQRDIFKLEVYCDANLGTNANPYPHVAYVGLYQGSPIRYRSRKADRVARSTLRAETTAASDMVESLLYHKALFDAVLPGRWKVQLFSDSMCLLKLLQSDYPRPAELSLFTEIVKLGDKLGILPYINLSEQLTDHHLRLEHVSTQQNKADALTKPMSTKSILELLTPTGISPKIQQINYENKRKENKEKEKEKEKKEKEKNEKEMNEKETNKIKEINQVQPNSIQSDSIQSPEIKPNEFKVNNNSNISSPIFTDSPSPPTIHPDSYSFRGTTRSGAIKPPGFYKYLHSGSTR